MSANDYVIRFHEGWETVDPHAWDALLDASQGPNPFMRHAFLAALTRSGSATAATGWRPRPLTLYRQGALVAACPLYEKTHSYGEYVFDWAWAHAHERHAVPYYPKLVVAVPFTPVQGTRLAARNASDRRALIEALTRLASRERYSSVHLLFGTTEDLDAAAAAGWLVRSGVQFHWRRRPGGGNARGAPAAAVEETADATGRGDFAEFLSRLQRDKRKKIQQDRRRVRDAGLTVEALHGRRIGPADWDFFYRCYVATYQSHGRAPYLTRAFFQDVSSTLPEHWLLLLARQGERPVAASLIALDPRTRVAYGRYWGSIAPFDALHFEACYYAPIEWCLREGYVRFEGGAQGEHKLSRGLEPVRTGSAHWIGHPGFRQAIAAHLLHESAGVDAYLDELAARSPYKREAPADWTGHSPPGGLSP